MRKIRLILGSICIIALLTGCCSAKLYSFTSNDLNTQIYHYAELKKFDGTIKKGQVKEYIFNEVGIDLTFEDGTRILTSLDNIILYSSEIGGK